MFQLRKKRRFVLISIVLFAIAFPAWAQFDTEDIPSHLQGDPKFWMRWLQIPREYQRRFEIAFRELWEQFSPLSGLTDAEKAARAQALLEEAKEVANASGRVYKTVTREIGRNWSELAMDKGIIPQQRRLPKQLSIPVLEKLRDKLAESLDEKERVKARDVTRAIQAQNEAGISNTESAGLNQLIKRYSTPEGLPTEKFISHMPHILAKMASAKGYAIPLAEQVYRDYLDPTLAERRVAPQLPEDPKEKVWQIAYDSQKKRMFHPSYYEALEEAFRYVDEHGPVKPEEVQRAIEAMNLSARSSHAVAQNIVNALTTFTEGEGLIPKNYATFYNRLADQNPRDPRLEVFKLVQATHTKSSRANTISVLSESGNAFFGKMRELATDETTAHYIEAAQKFFADAQVEEAKALQIDAANALRDFKVAARRLNPAYFSETETGMPPQVEPPPPDDLPPNLPPIAGAGGPPAPGLIAQITGASVAPVFRPVASQSDALPGPPTRPQITGPRNSILPPISGGGPRADEPVNAGLTLELEEVSPGRWRLPIGAAPSPSLAPNLLDRSGGFGFGSRLVDATYKGIRFAVKWGKRLAIGGAAIGTAINSVEGAIALKEGHETGSPVPFAEFISKQSFGTGAPFVDKLKEKYQDPLIARSQYYDEKWQQAYQGAKLLQDKQFMAIVDENTKRALTAPSQVLSQGSEENLPTWQKFLPDKPQTSADPLLESLPNGWTPTDVFEPFESPLDKRYDRLRFGEWKELLVLVTGEYPPPTNPEYDLISMGQMIQAVLGPVDAAGKLIHYHGGGSKEFFEQARLSSALPDLFINHRLGF